RVAGTVDGAGGLDEEQRLLRQRQAHLVSVVRVVQTDADDLADTRERRAESGAATDDWEPRRPGRAQALEARGREHRGRDVWDHARQVAHGAGFVDEPGLLGPGASVAHEPHGAGPSAPARERIAQNPRKSPSAASTASGLSSCSVWTARGISTNRPRGSSLAIRSATSRSSTWLFSPRRTRVHQSTSDGARRSLTLGCHSHTSAPSGRVRKLCETTQR